MTGQQKVPVNPRHFQRNVSVSLTVLLRQRVKSSEDREEEAKAVSVWEEKISENFLQEF